MKMKVAVVVPAPPERQTDEQIGTEQAGRALAEACRACAEAQRREEAAGDATAAARTPAEIRKAAAQYRKAWFALRSAERAKLEAEADVHTALLAQTEADLEELKARLADQREGRSHFIPEIDSEEIGAGEYVDEYEEGDTDGEE